MNSDQMELERIIQWISNSDQPSSNILNRPYFLVIFNNRQWSDYFRQQRIEEMQQRNLTAPPVIRYQSADELQQSLLDRRFNYELHQLVDSYIQQIERTFPLKSFIDFTDY